MHKIFASAARARCASSLPVKYTVQLYYHGTAVVLNLVRHGLSWYMDMVMDILARLQKKSTEADWNFFFF
jgi:hypothetical protein